MPVQHDNSLCGRQCGASRVFPLSLPRRSVRFVLILMMSIGIAFPALAQQFATLNLTVHDPSGSNVPQAKVTVRNVDTGAVREDVSDKTGIAVIPGSARTRLR
jgi:hypothetical protein